jgi:hypothetical protein
MNERLNSWESSFVNHEKEQFMSHVLKQIMKESFDQMSSIDGVLQSEIDLRNFTNRLNNQFKNERMIFRMNS